VTTDSPKQLASEREEKTPQPAVAAARRPWLGQLGILLVLLVIVGGAGSYVIENTKRYFGLPPDLQADTERLSAPYPPEFQAQLTYHTKRIARQNQALGFGTYGALVCGTLGLLIGAFHGSAGAAVRGLIGGAIAGAVLCGAFSMLNPLVFDRVIQASGSLAEGQYINNQSNTIQKAMAIHAPGWFGLALGAALTIGLATGQVRKGVQCIVPAIVGALIAAVVYPMFAAVLFPDSQVQALVPDVVGSRILWTSLTAALIGLAVGRTTLKPH
jgi:hypothetical protein